MNLSKYVVLAVIGGGLVIMAAPQFISGSRVKTASVDVRVPDLSALAVQGRQAYDANCALCHGPNASGTDKGPPLIHVIYNPGHHADESFIRAVKYGVRQHHWFYGDMPPIPDVTGNQIAAIIAYIRELQVANGITYRPHRM